MTTEAMMLPRVLPERRRDAGFPGLIPILLVYAVWAGWWVFTDPFGAIQADVRAGAAASVDTRFLSMISVVGLLGLLMFTVAVAAYVLAMRSMRHAR
jgi:hypothetical protein